MRLQGRTPLIFIEVPGEAAGTVLMYGHLDKQPEMKGWSEGTGPWEPVLRATRLYGRGGADDGYAMFASLSALLALKEQGIAHARAVIVIEACEESGSPDLPFYIDHLAQRIGTPDLVVCLDSGCGNYEQLWLTTSLRGMVMGNLTVRVLTEGVHSGAASGIVPSSFRILRQLLSRIEDEATGEMKLPALFVEVPQDRIAQAKAAAQILGDEVFSEMPFAGGTKPMAADNADCILNRPGGRNSPSPRWTVIPCRKMAAMCCCPTRPPNCRCACRRPATREARAPGGQDGAGKRPALWRRSDIRRPARRERLERADAGALAGASLNKASNAAFGKPVAFMGEGGSIPFMAMLGEKFPQDPVRRHRRAGPPLQRPRPQRIPRTSPPPRRCRPHCVGPGGSRVAER